MKIIIPWPPSINNYYSAGNKKYLLPAVRKYKQETAWIIKSQMLEKKMYKIEKEEICLKVKAYAPDKRVRDIDNILKAVFDTLALGGVYSNDKQIKILFLELAGECKPGYLEIEAKIKTPECRLLAL